MQLGHQVWMGGPIGREFSKVVDELKIPFVSLKPGKLSLILGAARFLRRQKVQILHARHGRDYWPAVFAARLSGVRPKIVLSRHLAKSPGAWASRRFLLGQCDAMLAVSHFVARVLRDGDADPKSDNPERHSRPPMFGDLSKVLVVYGGFDMERFQPREVPAQRQVWGLAKEHYAFAVVGGYSLPRGKGQREFLQAAQRVHSVMPNARFLIIGRGDMKPLLEADITRFGLSDSAQLTPYCHDMPAAMNAIDCMVLPQVGTEAIPGVVCEAHACGKPVIASDLDGIPEAFSAAGYGQLVQRSSVEALADAMIAWGRKPALDMPARRALHSRVAERFSLERASRDLAEVYEMLMCRPTRKSSL
jgi:glycosyltransferase involved in cell wall biosynthesis